MITHASSPPLQLVAQRYTDRAPSITGRTVLGQMNNQAFPHAIARGRKFMR
jgi:hypothetical protein